MTYPLQSSNSSGGGNILLKNEILTGQNLEIMAFKYLKTLVFDNFLKKLHYLIFLFLKSIITNNYPPLYDYPTLSPIYTYPTFISGKLT